MSDGETGSGTAAQGSVGDSEQLLHRILHAIENDKRRGWLELALAIILSLATLASTWCAYQSRQWGGMQGDNQSAADTAERKAAESTIVALQMRTFDGILLLKYWDALRSSDSKSAELLLSRMRPQLQSAVRASLEAGILDNPHALSPMQRPEYALQEEADAKVYREDAGKERAVAQEAGQQAGAYVLLTLMFASVLFFGGITGTFSARPVRTGLGCVALGLFLLTIALLTQLPICGS